MSQPEHKDGGGKPPAETTKQIGGATTTTAPCGIVTHWIDRIEDAMVYCEHILLEAPLNTWCGSTRQTVDAVATMPGSTTTTTAKSMTAKNNSYMGEEGCLVRVSSATKVVAVDLEGINLSRTGEITIISVATDKGVYLFDVVCLGTEGVAVLTAMLLQNPAVLKVLFDCRQDCDSLYHQYNQCLVHPICDLQVSCVLHLLPPERRNYLIGMARSFKDKLKVFSQEELEIKQKVGLKTFDEKGGNSLLWKTRPIDPDLVSYSAIDVKHMFSAMEILAHSNVVAKQGACITLGITIGCQRRDRTLANTDPVPHSAECDFKDLLEREGYGVAGKGIHRIPGHNQLHTYNGAGAGYNGGGSGGYSVGDGGVFHQYPHPHYISQPPPPPPWQSRGLGGNGAPMYYPQQLPQCLYCQEVGHSMIQCPHHPQNQGGGGFGLPTIVGGTGRGGMGGYPWSHLQQYEEQQHYPHFLNRMMPPQPDSSSNSQGAVRGEEQQQRSWRGGRGGGRGGQQKQQHSYPQQQQQQYHSGGESGFGHQGQQPPPEPQPGQGGRVSSPHSRSPTMVEPNGGNGFDQQPLLHGGPGGGPGGTGSMGSHQSHGSSGGSGTFAPSPNSSTTDGSGGGGQLLSCYTCGGTGHVHRTCPSRQQQQPKQHQRR